MSNIHIQIILGDGPTRTAEELLLELDGLAVNHPSVINMVLPSREKMTTLPQLLEGLKARLLSWQLAEIIMLKNEDAEFLPDAVCTACAATPPAQEVWLCVDPNARIRYDRLRPVLNKALEACSKTEGSRLRCVDLPLCAADEHNWGFFMTRQERRRFFTRPFIGGSLGWTDLPMCDLCNDCLASRYCPGIIASQANTGLACIEGDNKSIPMLQFQSEASSPLRLSRYTDVQMDSTRVRLKNRLYGAIVTIAVAGAQQQRLLDALRWGIPEMELILLLKCFGLSPDIFQSMLQGCVIE